MGSSNNRNKKDRPIIQKPKGGGGGAGNSEKAASECPPSFRVDMDKYAEDIEKGDVLQLRANGDQYEIIHNGHSIHTVDAETSEMITTCNDLGVNYQGKVVEQSDAMYGQFSRT